MAQDAIDAIEIPVEERPTGQVTLHGREITLQKFTSTQIMQLQHVAMSLEKGSDDTELLRKYIYRVFKIIAGGIPEEKDQDFLDDCMSSGEMSLMELIKALLQFNRDVEGGTPPPPRVRRGRPRRVA